MNPAGAISMMVMGYVRSLNKKLASKTVVSTRPRGSWINGHPTLPYPIKTSSAQAGSSSANQQHPRWAPSHTWHFLQTFWISALPLKVAHHKGSVIGHGHLTVSLAKCNFFLNAYIGNSLAVQWLGLHAFTAKGTGSIPSGGTEIL